MRTFVICRMYAGTYINDKMGGEIINLLHDDNGNNYIYVNPYGYIAKQYDNTVEAVILTRLEKAGCFEVLGIAKIGKDGQLVFPKGYTTYEKMQSTGEQLQKKEIELDIKYAGIRLSDIYNGQLNGAITFKSDILLQPKNAIYITDSHFNEKNTECITYKLNDKRFPNQSLISYITNSENPNSFNIIESIINNTELWEIDKKNTISSEIEIDNKFNFLKIIKQEDNELVYSNLFGYIFTNYSDIFIEFAKEVLNVNISSNYIIEREKENIDIWIEDENNIIVIENKIKSGINGISPRHDFSEDGLIQSQLLKYYNYATSIKGDKNLKFFIFLPVYNRVDIKQYSGSKNYEEINYKEIYSFFNKKQVEDIYYKEFVNALYKHTKDREIDYFEDMQIRFLNQIKIKTKV